MALSLPSAGPSPLHSGHAAFCSIPLQGVGSLRSPLKRIPRCLSPVTSKVTPVLRKVVSEGKPEAQWQSWGEKECTNGCYGNRGSQDGGKRKGGPAPELPWQPRSSRPALKTKTTRSPLTLKYPGLLGLCCGPESRMGWLMFSWSPQLISQTL